MSNHYHIALETPAANLVEGMQWLQGTFALRFNRLRQEHGHLFQGRYKCLLVDPTLGWGRCAIISILTRCGRNVAQWKHWGSGHGRACGG